MKKEDNASIYREDIERVVNEMSDNITDSEMQVILDQTFSTFGLAQSDSISEEKFIKVLSSMQFIGL